MKRAALMLALLHLPIARAQESQPASEPESQPAPEPAPPAAPAPAPAAAPADDVRADLEALKDEVATKEDLKKYQRKPDEREGKSRSTQEVEARVALTDLRQDELAAAKARLAALAMAPGSNDQARALIARLGGLADSLLANDARLRPRFTLRLYWETSRFLNETEYLYANVEPELMFFVLPDDLDRAALARDVALPRERMAIIFKKAALGLQAGRLGLEAGFLQFTYGAGFFVNPTNPFTPKNPLDPRKEVDGVPAAKVDVALVSREELTLSAQAAAVVSPVRNDVLGAYRDQLAWSGLAVLRADLHVVSLTGIAIWQQPNDFGLDSASFGGIASATPWGLTASVEALFTEGPFGGDYDVELVASLQGFTSAVGANGTTYVLEYYRNGHLPTDAAQAGADLGRAVLSGNALVAVDRLLRPLGRRQYLDAYLEPSLTEKLRVNVSGLVSLDGAAGGLARVGADYVLKSFTVHGFAGALLGSDSPDSEFGQHFVQWFAELAITASL